MGGESARPGKRPQRALTTLEKIEAIVRVHEGESKASVARDIGVPESTLRGWCKSEQKLRDTAARGSPESGASSPASTSGAAALSSLASASGLQLSSAVAAAAAAAAANNGSNSDDEAQQQQQAPSTRSSMRQSSRKRKSELAEDCLAAEAAAAGIVSSSDSATCSSTTSGSKLDSGAIASAAKQPKLDYVQSLLSSLRSAQDNSLLLQQINLLSKMQNGATLASNLMSLAAVTAATSHNNGSGGAASFVENGLQYSKSSSGRGASRTSSAVAPTSHLDSVSKSGGSSRKSLPPAAEAPTSLVPTSPRRSGDLHSGLSATTTNGHQQSKSSSYSHSSGGKKDGNGLTKEQRQHEETLRLWLQQQQVLLGQANLNQHMAAAAVAGHNGAASDGSWFWQWYKQCSYPSAGSLSSLSSHVAASAANSPSKVKAVLDNVLGGSENGQNGARRSLATTTTTTAAVTAEDLSVSATADEPLPSSEEAIEYGEKFFKWLNRCSDPSVTQMQIMQFKFLLDSLKSCRAKPTSSKHSRK